MGRTVFYEGRFVRKVLLCNGHEGTLLDGRIIRGSIPACGVCCRTGEERRLLRIVSWNCNGKFREKRQRLYAQFPADVYIIQECEKPEKYGIEYNGVWMGNSEHRGLGVFVSDRLAWTVVEQDSHGKQFFCPVQIGEYLLIAVWAKAPYIEEVMDYFSVNESLLRHNAIVMGDLNSNVIWDRKHGTRDHSSFNRLTGRYGLVSAYHTVTGDMFGSESAPTFYMYRHAHRPYHIDYAYLQRGNLLDFGVGSVDDWLAYSDHMPIWLDVK